MVVEEQMLAVAADQVNTAVAITNSKGELIWANQSFVEFADGKSKDALENRNITDLLPKKSAIPLQHLINRSLQEQQPFNQEVSMTSQNGQTLWWDVKGHPMAQSDRFGEYLFTFEDVTQRKRYQNQVRVSEERFRLMANNTTVLLWIANAEGSVTFANAAWCQYVGRSAEYELGHGWTENLHPNEKDYILGEFAKIFMNQQPFVVEYRVRRGDGSYGWLLERGIPMFNTDGRFEGIMGTCFDITERKAIEFDLSRKSEVLEAVKVEYAPNVKKQIEALEALLETITTDQQEALRVAIASLKRTYANMDAAIHPATIPAPEIEMPNFIFL